MSKSEGNKLVEQKMNEIHDHLTRVEAHVTAGEYQKAVGVAEDMRKMAEATGCSMCMKTASGVLAGLAWVTHLPSDADDRKEAYLSSIRNEIETVETELEGL